MRMTRGPFSPSEKIHQIDAMVVIALILFFLHPPCFPFFTFLVPSMGIVVVVWKTQISKMPQLYI